MVAVTGDIIVIIIATYRIVSYHRVSEDSSTLFFLIVYPVL